MFNLDVPLNSNERYLHGINVRLDILIDMLSKFVEVYASENSIVTENNTVEEISLTDSLEEEVVDVDYSTLTVALIKKELDDKGIPYTPSMRKNELIDLLG